MDEEKCSTEARCSVCTTSVMAAYSACEKFGIVNHECLQKVNITQSMNNMGINRNEDHEVLTFLGIRDTEDHLDGPQHIKMRTILASSHFCEYYYSYF